MKKRRQATRHSEHAIKNRRPKARNRLTVLVLKLAISSRKLKSFTLEPLLLNPGTVHRSFGSFTPCSQKPIESTPSLKIISRDIEQVSNHSFGNIFVQR